jgi:hypothetical protein
MEETARLTSPAGNLPCRKYLFAEIRYIDFGFMQLFEYAG